MPALEKLGRKPIIVFDSLDLSIPCAVTGGYKTTSMLELCAVLKQRFPTAPSPVPLLMWDIELSSFKSEADQSVLQDLPKGVLIMDRDGLRSMGLVF